MWLGHVYYAIGLLVFLSTILVLSKLKSYLVTSEWFSRFEKVTGRKPSKKDFRSDDESNLLSTVAALSVFEFVWVLMGLLTSSWYIYLSLLIYSMIIGVISKLVDISFIRKILTGHFLIVKILV